MSLNYSIVNLINEVKMMYVCGVTVRRKFSLGNYETEDIEVQIALNEGEKASDAIDKARQFIESKSQKRNQQRMM